MSYESDIHLKFRCLKKQNKRFNANQVSKKNLLELYELKYDIEYEPSLIGIIKESYEDCSLAVYNKKLIWSCVRKYEYCPEHNFII